MICSVVVCVGGRVSRVGCGVGDTAILATRVCMQGRLAGYRVEGLRHAAGTRVGGMWCGEIWLLC